MLLNFTVENWMSYRHEASLRMVSSLERRHANTLAKLPGFRSKKVLPVAAMYGGNASGKTGLFKGIAALKYMVTGDLGIDEPLPIVPFALTKDDPHKPSTFDITFLSGKTIYRYVVEATQDGVKYESLEQVEEKGSVDIFERDEVTSHSKYRFNEDVLGALDYLQFVGKSTRPNQTFLGTAVAQNVEGLQEAYGWFVDTLQLVGVETDARPFADAVRNKEGFFDYAAMTLERLDTGICSLAGERINIAALPPSVRIRKSIAHLQKDDLLTVVMEKGAGDYGFEMITVYLEDGQPVAERLHTRHRGEGGVERSLSMGMESSGTQRLMGLLPMLYDLQSHDEAKSKVYIVDELDRCLHTMLTTHLLEDFLAGCSAKTRKQLLFTTHDLLLMDQSLMRRDEMYIVQRDIDGVSELVGLTEFDGIRHDKDLIRSYLDGRFGGIPMLGKEVSIG